MRPIPSVNFKFLVQAFTAGLLTLLVTGLSAQTWPSKPVRVIVPFPPGGASDALARTVAQNMSEQLGQPFLVDNKPGAASTIGIAEAAKTPADGYTILLAAAPYVITQYVYPKLSYDVRKDFVPLGLLQTTPTLLVVNPALGVNTMADFLKLAKSKPGQVSYATPGGGSLPHLIGELFKQQAGIDMMHVPYKGGGPALADLLAGHVNSSFLSPIEVNAHTKSGKLIALGASSLKRTPALAALPTKVVRASAAGPQKPRDPRQDRPKRRCAGRDCAGVCRVAGPRAWALGAYRQGRQHQAGVVSYGCYAPQHPVVQR